jgi:hypothetical protein
VDDDYYLAKMALYQRVERERLEALWRVSEG